jgi:hypothetical protein
MAFHFARTPSRPLVRRLLRWSGWLVGAPLAIFRFLRRRIPIEELDPAGESAPLTAEDPDPDHRQDEHGVGPVVHQLYAVAIRAPKLAPEQLLAIIAADPNVIAPSEVLRFEKGRGEAAGLREGEELLIRMAGPWNGPVRVTRRWQLGFRLAATRGHAQLGQLELRVRGVDGDLAVEIQTRERAAGLAVYLLQRVGLIRRMQAHTWAEMLENAARLAGGLPPERITVRSWRSSGARQIPSPHVG